MSGIETLLLIGAGSGCLYAVAGYLKNRKEGEKFSWGKLIGTGITGAISGLVKYVPVLGDIFTSIGGVAVGKKAVKLVKPRRLPRN